MSDDPKEDAELAAAAERSRIWRMSEEEVIEHCTDLGHSLVPDHAGIWRMSCWSCGGRAVLNAGSGYYGSLTTERCDRST